MLKDVLIATTISAAIATLIYVLVQYIYDRRFESAETVFFAIVAWITFLVTNFILERKPKLNSKP